MNNILILHLLLLPLLLIHRLHQLPRAKPTEKPSIPVIITSAITATRKKI